MIPDAGAPNLMIYEPAIKYTFKEGENEKEVGGYSRGRLHGETSEISVNGAAFSQECTLTHYPLGDKVTP